MSSNLILVSMVLYFYIGVEQYFKYDNLPMGIVWTAYGFANIGLYLAASK
jgi:hypothetical protein